MQKWTKKVFMAILLSSLFLFLIACEGKTDETDEPSQNDFNTVLRFGVISDTHIKSTHTVETDRLKLAIDKMYSIAEGSENYKKLDAVVVAGDLTDNGEEDQLNLWKSTVDSALKEGTKLVVTPGNHEFYNECTDVPGRFNNIIGEIVDNNITINGFHFITVSPSDGSSYTGKKDWLDEQLDAAKTEDPLKPIFLIQHHHISDTVYGSDAWGTGDISSVLRRYSQVIDFSGHSHYPLNDPKSIYQDDFTAVGTSTLSYFELESGMVYGTIPPNADKAAQMLIVEVSDKNAVKIYPYDLLADTYINEEPWYIETPSDKSTFTYNTKDRAEAADLPVFPEDASIEITNVADDGFTVEFTQATDGENIHSYNFEVTYKENNMKAMQASVWSEYYFIPMPEKINQQFKGLYSGMDYTLKIYAVDSYGKVSDSYLTTDFTTTGEIVDMETEPYAADIIDVDFNGSVCEDKSAMKTAIEIIGSPMIETDVTLNKPVGKFFADGFFKVPFNNDTYTKIKDQITLECIFSASEFKDPYNDIFGNMQGGGIGFELARITDEKGRLEFWVHTGGDYKIINTMIEKDKYYHVIGTFDGQLLNLYINGDKVASLTLDNASEITYTSSATSKYFAIGADSAGGPEGEAYFSGSISVARLYSKVMNDFQIGTLFKNGNITV
ncbi:MAG: purple acid phosphatase/fibronectin domain protein, partial [Clostridia bacterium]|nr:purple acid phosphatase/fibronectin domain protein [Clostridia bacterium]